MSLPSQVVRPQSRRANMFRRQRRRRRISMVVAPVLLIGGAALAWQLWPGRASAGSDAENHSGGPEMLASSVQRESSRPLSETSGRSRSDDADRRSSQVPRLGDGGRGDRATTAPQSSQRTKDRSAAARPTPRDRGTAATTESKTPEKREKQQAPPLKPEVTPPARETAPPPAAAIERSSPRVETTATASRPPREPDAAAGLSDAQRTARARMDTGLELLARNDLVRGRHVLSQILLSGQLSPADERMVRDRVAVLNERLVFSPEVIPGDPYVLTYTIESGDVLSKLPRRLGLMADWRFIQRINRISSPQRIRMGQQLKVVTGPFHAVINKHDYRMDIYLGDESDPVYVRSFSVGLGEFNSTPEGRFRVRANSRLINPEWVNPRTRERYLPDDPMNPIGEYWIGLEGDEPRLSDLAGYGIHGTIEPESIGRQASMGCIRMLPDDVKLVYELLLEDVSRIEIRK